MNAVQVLALRMSSAITRMKPTEILMRHCVLMTGSIRSIFLTVGFSFRTSNMYSMQNVGDESKGQSDAKKSFER